MRTRVRAATLAVFIGVVACGGETPAAEPSNPPGKGAETAIGAVDDLIAAIHEPDFAEASRLAVPGQAALAALAEGATFGEVADGLTEGDEEIAANFWSGFAQGAGSFLSGSVTTEDAGTITEGDVEFHSITVSPSGGDSRTLLVRDDDGYRVDVFASFGSGLADKMIAPVERLLSTKTEEARIILTRLKEVVPSLLAAASIPGTSGEASQHLLALVEVITRVS
jgi:hypothetical protein